MTKPIIPLKICYKILYVIQVVYTSLIGDFLASADIEDFCHTYVVEILTDTTLKLSFEKLKPAFFQNEHPFGYV